MAEASAEEVQLRFSLDEEVSNKVAATEDIYTWVRDSPVKLRMGKEETTSRDPISVPSLLKNTVKRVPDNVALVIKRDGKDLKWTYMEYYEAVIQTAKSFIKIGLEPYHGVAILGYNMPEWFFSDLGAIYVGGFATGIYTTNSPQACHYILEAADCQVAVVENDIQLQKILKVWEKLPNLKAVVQYTGDLKEKKDNIYTWEEFIAFGKDIPDTAVQERLDQIYVNKCCTLVFTSGTTGSPKGVMMSHDNLTWPSPIVCETMEAEYGKESCISYLPLSHIAAQSCDIYIPMACGASVTFAAPDALKGSLVNTLQWAKPSYMLGVPRVWEKIMEALKAAGKNASGLKKWIGTWAKGVGLRGNLDQINGRGRPWGWTLADKLVFSVVRAKLGLDKTKMCFSGAAPMSRETQEYLMGFNIVVMETYGMSELPGAVMAVPTANKLGSSGKAIEGVEIVAKEKGKDGNGEICAEGRNVFMGYLNMEDRTKESIDKEGYLHTGDIGTVDDEGFLFITGRIKELIITAGGENIPPVLIEDVVKEELPVVSQCMLIGDKRKFLSMLITLKVDVDKDTLIPTDNLAPLALDWCRSKGSDATTVTELLNNADEKVTKGIQDGINKANDRAVSNAQRIQKWTIVPVDFSIHGGELGPTLKMMRYKVLSKYEDLIEKFYS